ncbi:MAG: phosphoglycerate mutase family protein [Reichenbachiella sp.]|uniref:SixA phosphatase family protein n=1 Tax=Reichenbachiella sp. TaxID=2184521 RepID=UPI003265C323
MNLIKHLTIALAILVLPILVMAQENDDFFTIYLVRHAEKEQSKGNDPDLTLCGQQRAELLADFFEAVKIDALYSSDYLRTKNTLLPTAQAKQMDYVIYDPSKLEIFAAQLKDRKQDALVIGHSNTTGVLAGLLIGEEIGAFDERIYNRIYQVVVSKKTGRLHIFHTSFSCEN